MSVQPQNGPDGIRNYDAHRFVAVADLKIVNKANTLLPVIVTCATKISLSLGFVASLKCLDSPISFILEM